MHPLDAKIVAVLATAMQGISVSEIAGRLAADPESPPPERTLKRRLTMLVRDGRIRRAGKGPATRYSADDPDARNQEQSPESIVPLGAAARALQDEVRRPIAARTPIGYNERFLREYSPTGEGYLDLATREHLRQAGEATTIAPAGTFARQIYERLLIDLAWSSSRLEGNTYSRLDTERLLRDGIGAEGKDSRDAQMILNHKKAIELLVDGADSIGFNRYTLLNLHAALSENLLGNPADEGRLRTTEVGITGTTYVPLSVPQKLEELFDLFLIKADAIGDPFEQAFFAMVHLPYLQPFIDVNKRVSRLAANIPFIRTNLCPLSFVDVPERTYVEGTLAVYEHNQTALLRDLFVWAYERAASRYRVIHQSLPEPDPIRLRYRLQLGEVVRDAVTGARTPPLSANEHMAEVFGIDPEHLNAFVALAEATLAGLHEGNFARYGVRPSEFRSWILRNSAS